jgi:SecD/SecF fusion protein
MAWYYNLPLILGQAEGAANVVAPQPEEAKMAWYIMLFVAVGVAAVTILPFIIGSRIAKSFRMNDHGWKIGLILATLASGITIVIFGWPPKTGIDLSGGVILVYEIDPKASRTAEDEAADKEDGLPDDYQDINVDELVRTLSKRINPGGVKEIVVRRYGPNQVEVIVPHLGHAEVEEIKKRIITAGHLRFRILADSGEDLAIIERANEPSQKNKTIVKSVTDEAKAEWVKLGKDDKGEERFSPGQLAEGNYVVRPGALPGSQEVLVLIQGFNVEGGHLRGAVAGFGGMPPGPIVNFRMTARGGVLFGALTGANRPNDSTGFQRKLGIIMDDELLSAPNIIQRITDRGQITGRFSKEEVEFLVGILKAGRLPAALRKDPISENRVSSMLGADTIRKGKVAIGISLVAVLVFMVFYYRFSGMVACLALITNLILILSLMILFKAALTLPGLAGLVLTVGMSVDANVLVFERIREELARGAALRMALRNGFGRATTTIVDANLTTLITAIVLYAIGTDQIRGFAVTLILGILMSMYTAIFCSRVLFDVAERRKWITELPMMRLLGATHIDFIGKRRIAAACSVLLIAIGLGATAYRGRDILDIDFNGGTSVRVLLKKGIPIDDTRKLVEEGGLPDVWVTGVDVDGKDSQGQTYKDRVYKIDTSLTNFGIIGTIKITDRSGKSAIVDLSDAETREDVVKAIKQAGVNVEVTPHEDINGFIIKDRTGDTKSNFIIANGDDGLETADWLNIAHNGPETAVDSGSLRDCVDFAEVKLIEMFEQNGASLLAMHDMQFEEPTLLASAAGVPPESEVVPPETTGEEALPETTGEETTPGTTGEETSPETTEEETSPKPTGEDTSPETTGEETSPKPAGEEASPETAGEETSPETTAEETAPETTSEETAPETTGEETPSPATTSDDPADETSDETSDETADETTPEGDAGQDAAPKTSDGTRSDLPDDRTLAFAGGDLMLLAQADTSAEDTPETGENEASTEAPAETAGDVPAETPDAADADAPSPEDDSAAPADADAAPKETPGKAPADAEPPSGEESASSETEEAAAETEGAAAASADADAPAKESGDDAPAASEETPAATDTDAEEEMSETESEQPAADAEAGQETEPAAEPEAEAAPNDPQPAEVGDEDSTNPTESSEGGDTPAGPAVEETPAVENAAPVVDPDRTTGPALEEAGEEEVPLVFRSETKLTFDEPINAATVKAQIEDAAKELEIPIPAVELANDKWDKESSKGFKEWDLKISTDLEQTTAILSKIRGELANDPVWPSSSKIGGAVAGKMKQMAIAALLTSLIGIVGYIWFRFQKVAFGLAAVVALVHDVAITLGAIALSYWLASYFGFLLIDNFKISLPVVAAFLTIIGYSLNDTIVVFDRIREVKGKSPDLTGEMINKSINQTLNRTLLTSITTLLVVLILYVLGGQGIHSFAYCLLVGVLVGTYSSVFVASPFLLWMTGGSKSPAKQQAS